MKVELKKIKIYDKLSDETTAFYGEIFINGKNCGYAKNEGRGGPTDYYAYPGFKEEIEDAELYFKSLPEIVYPKDDYPELSIECNFENWIDLQVYNNQKEIENKKLIKLCEKNICYKCYGGYKMIGWKNFKIEEMLKTPNGIKTIQNVINDLKSKGEIILNTNLTGINL